MDRRQLKNIAEGIYFAMTKPEEIEKQAIKRLKICEPCPVNKFGICSLCWCPVHTKAHAPEVDCELGKW